MNKDEKKKMVVQLIDHMKDMLLEGIENMPDNDYHPVELIVSAGNTLYMYAQLHQQGLTDTEIVETIKQIAKQAEEIENGFNTQDHIIEQEPEKVISMLDKIKKRNDTVH